MQLLLAPDLLGIMIQTVGAILVALIAKGAKDRTWWPKRGLLSKTYLSWGFMGVSAALTFALMGALYSLAVRPTISITSPAADQAIEMQAIETGSGSFSTTGTSAGVYSKSNLRLYVLVHPAQPFASGWWVQAPATVDRTGRWSTIAWYGAKDFPPQTGNRLEIIAVVADPADVAGRSQVADPKDLQPVAQSDVIGVRVGAVK